MLATFAQLTDTHVRDEESPARVALLDRLGAPFTSAFRPQEALPGRCSTARCARSTAQHPQAVFVTGDIIDNAQENELTRRSATLAADASTPTAAPGATTACRTAELADPFYYRPDLDAAAHPGPAGAAERPFRAGPHAPWYPLVGNHDVLVQGEVPPTPATERVRHRRPEARPRSTPDARGRRATAADARPAYARLLRADCPVSSILVAGRPAAPRARAPREVAAAGSRAGERPRRQRPVARLRRSTSAPGRGRSCSTRSAATAARGARPPGQAAVARAAQLARRRRALGRRLLAPRRSTRDGWRGRRCALLDRDPHVVAAIAGDTHRNWIEARRRGRRLLADHHVVARRLPAAGADVPAAEDRRGRRAGDVDGRPRSVRPARNDLAGARVPRLPGRPPAALRRYARRPQRRALFANRPRQGPGLRGCGMPACPRRRQPRQKRRPVRAADDRDRLRLRRRARATRTKRRDRPPSARAAPSRR